MSQLRKIFGTSLVSLFLVIWGLFMVCSGRVPDVNYEDEFSAVEDNYQSAEQADLMEQLAMLDEDSTNLQPGQRDEILQALGIESASGTEAPGQTPDDFLTEELFLDLEVEIAELEKLSKKKGEMIDSLNLEIQEADYRLSALGNVLGSTATSDIAATESAPRLPVSNGSMSAYEASYQDALNDVYGHNYQQAIGKFRDLLKANDKEELADNAQYWIGECLYAMKNYELAIAEFEKVFAFEHNNKADDAQYMIGKSYLRLGNRALAQLELGNLLMFYEKSEYAARAERELLDLNI